MRVLALVAVFAAACVVPPVIVAGLFVWLLTPASTSGQATPPAPASFIDADADDFWAPPPFTGR